MSPGVSGSLRVVLPFSLGSAVLPAMQFASKAHAFPHTLLFCEVPLFPTAAAAGSSFGETACALKHVSVTLGKGWPDGVLFPARPQFCVICRITTPLHNQGSRRRSRRWKSLSVGSMVGSEEELSSSVILTRVCLTHSVIMLVLGAGGVSSAPVLAVTPSSSLSAVGSADILPHSHWEGARELCC